MTERMRPGVGPKGVPNGNGVPHLPPVGQNQNQQPTLPVPQVGVLSFEQARQQQQQQQQDDSWAKPPPHPSDRRALTPITERSTRDSNSCDTNPIPLHRPGFSTVNGSPLQPDQIQKQQSDTSQDLPKLQTDAEPPTFLGEVLVTSPTSHIPLHELGIDRTDSAVSLGLKSDSRQVGQGPALDSGPESELDGYGSTDVTHPAGDSSTSPLNPPGKEPVFSAPPLPQSNQPVQPVPSTFSNVPKTPPRSPDRPAFTPPIRKGPGAESGSPTPSLSSRFQGAIQRKEGSSPSNPLPATTKAKTPEPSPLQQSNPYPNSPAFSPTPTTTNSPPTLTHTTPTTVTSSTSKSEHSGYFGSAKPSLPQYTQEVSSVGHLNQDSQSHSDSTPQSQRTAQGNLEGTKPAGEANWGKEGGGDDQDLMKEAGALYYVQEIQNTTAVRPPRLVGRGQSIPAGPRGQPDSDDEGGDRGKPLTRGAQRPLPQQTQAPPQPQPRPSLPPEPSPLQVRKQSLQAKASLPPQPPPQPSPEPPHYPSQNRHQDRGYAQGREQQTILAPQPQQPVTSSFDPVRTMEGDAESPSLSYADSDTNPTSPAVDSRRMSVIGSGGQGGSRPGLASRPSGARDQKQRAGTTDSVSSHSRHNAQLQPRHPLPPHPESSTQQPSQFFYSTHTQPSYHRGQVFSQALGDTTQQIPQAISNSDRYPANMANVNQHQNYDDNSDALAALTFLERDEANAVPKPPKPPRFQEKTSPPSEPVTLAYDTPPVHVIPSDSRDDVSRDSGSYEGKYRSSFAPSKQATQRLAKTQAQQAAHQAAAHRPGKSGGASGKGKRRARQDGWAESSDEEEEEEEEEDDEDVDSDGDPVASRRSQGPGAGPGQNLGRLSTQGSPYGSSTDLNQGKSQRNLPRPPSPGRGYGTSHLPTFFLVILPHANITPRR